MKCYQWLVNEAGKYQPECSGENCAKFVKKTGMCADVVTALSLASIKYVMNHPGGVQRDSIPNRSEDIPF